MTQSIGFILLPGYSSMTYVSAMEPLLMCNELMGEPVFQTFTVALAGRKTVSSLGNAIDTNYSLDDAPKADVWIIAGTTPARHPPAPELDAFLLAREGTAALGGLASGSYTLAHLGLLNGYRGVVHWLSYDELLQKHKSILLASEQFCIDRDRLTCRGGSSSLDLMLMWIAKTVGADTAEAISKHFVNERLGVPNSAVPRELSERTRAEQPKLAEALELMENNIEEPLTTDDIAFHVTISRRQLERLFKKHMNAVPSRYYLQIRLEEARRRLFKGNDSIADIGLSCGFSSGAHFSTAYRNQYGLTPSEDRSLNQKMQLEK
ncbi:GlxA family transcriptional regulator [Reinekea blandensis]|uniref:Transcriptional regulator containing an amidase domain and an AraC-type DNA-binding HTH domain n=1 Tax=Reinekea blandensis MED297 TaxID=314283 RepID=A4BJ15_9GAMM|nr:GlxA family transcriptional regulator [Reinekea blandensis]EAR07860.1 Transcriptional regulator containing an amidase domain and an AraC-type DNA-binding HTH domain [Reinekea sp. MED297] [Reinekea blandensis MED297]